MRLSLRSQVAILALSAILLPGAAASEGTRTKAINVGLDADVSIKFGSYVSGLGDVNGDGADDFAVSNCWAGDDSGTTRVVFGPVNNRRLDGETLRGLGFAIVGEKPDDLTCNVRRVGDVNGDGLDDVLIGALGSEVASRHYEAGRAYVVFGRDSTGPVRLSDLQSTEQTDGFRIKAAGGLSAVGRYLDGAGDVNGDGRDDLVLGALGFGSVYVVFGKTDGVPVNLRDFEEGTQGMQGYRVDTPIASNSSNFSVSGTGDANDDGLADIVVGVISSDSISRGRAYVVFGKRDPLPLAISEPAVWGYMIRGPRRHSDLGMAVSPAGDIDGDERADTLIGAPAFSNPMQRGRAFVIFGKSDMSTVETANLEDAGIEIVGDHPNDDVGREVSATGDINGDGTDDVLIGAVLGIFTQRKGGAAFAVHGSSAARRIELSNLGGSGFRIDGARYGDKLGLVAEAGDINGDGCDDILVGAEYRPKAYLIWGCSN